MNSRRRTLPAIARSYAVKQALLAGAAIAAFWPAAVLAQPADVGPPASAPEGRQERGQILNENPLRPPEQSRTTSPVKTDGLKPGELYLEADRIIRDDKNGVTTAEGSVEVRYEDRTLRADRLVYKEAPAPPAGEARPPQDRESPAQGVIRAYGHVQIINDDGTIEYADQMVLDDRMQAGVALAFAVLPRRSPALAAGLSPPMLGARLPACRRPSRRL